MPDAPTASTQIPIGFGLSGYEFMEKKKEQATAQAVGAGGAFGGAGGSMGGMNAEWAGGLIDDRWVADDKLKQVQVQTTCFQSAPLRLEADGGPFYGEIFDGIDEHSYIGGGAFTGCNAGGCGARLTPTDVNSCNGGNLSSKLAEWEAQISRSQSGRTDFYVGAAFCPVTLDHYLQHFYNITVPPKGSGNLAGKKILNIEILFNLTGNSGKAFHVRIVDSSGGRGYKGGLNNIKGAAIDYDLIDMMQALLATKTFSEVMTFTSKKYGDVNGPQLKFPWYDAGYNYKTGSIPGYGPRGIAQLGLKYQDDSALAPGSHGIWHSKGRSPHGHALARVRFFVDPENADAARSVIPGLPDEFFQTNYSNGGSAEWASGGSGIALDPSQYSDVTQLILATADKLNASITGSHSFHYGGPYLRSSGGGGFPAYTTGNGHIDCDGFVNWVLLEAGLTKDTGICNRKAGTWTASILNQALVPGYKAVDMGTDISNAIRGDIVVFGRGTSHAAFFWGFEAGRVIEIGMGSEKRVQGTNKNPSRGAYGTSSVSCFLRIVKDGSGGGTGQA